MEPAPDSLPRDGQGMVETIGRALQAYARLRWPNHTAKEAARAWGLDVETGRNVTKGHASPKSLAQAIRAEGYEILDALGEAIVGVSRAEWEQAKLQKLQEELRHATTQCDLLVARAARMEGARTSLQDAERPSSDAHRPPEGAIGAHRA